MSKSNTLLTQWLQGSKPGASWCGFPWLSSSFWLPCTFVHVVYSLKVNADQLPFKCTLSGKSQWKDKRTNHRFVFILFFNRDAYAHLLTLNKDSSLPARFRLLQSFSKLISPKVLWKTKAEHPHVLILLKPPGALLSSCWTNLSFPVRLLVFILRFYLMLHPWGFLCLC